MKFYGLAHRMLVVIVALEITHPPRTCSHDHRVLLSMKVGMN